MKGEKSDRRKESKIPNARAEDAEQRPRAEGTRKPHNDVLHPAGGTHSESYHHGEHRRSARHEDRRDR